jgi:transcription elongation GreA/GreB family factor
MNTLARPWITTHGSKKLERERSDLRDWLDHLKLRIQRDITDHKKNKKISLILSEEQVVTNRLERIDTACDRSRALPPIWGHKTEARAGDTIYLRHKDNIRALLLAATWDADPINGKVSVASPIGSALIGRRTGDKVHINTLDGNVEYQILKIL